MTELQAAERRMLGSSGIEITPLGIGAWQWGDRLVWGYGKGYAENDVEEAFRESVQSGITFYDTAEMYGSGKSERFMGDFLKRLPPSAPKLVIATKFFPLPWRVRRNSLVEALKRSLARLALDRVDLYQIHWPTPLVPVETWVNGLADAVEAGLTRAVGVSNYNVAQTRRAQAVLKLRGLALASNQVEYSLVHRMPEKSGLLQLCRDTNTTLIAYSPIGKGILTGKYTPDNPPPGVRGRKYNPAYLTRVQPLMDLLREIADRHDKTPAQVSLNWVICKGAVPIPGAKNARQARDNAGALGWRLDEAEVAALDQASDRLVA